MLHRWTTDGRPYAVAAVILLATVFGGLAGAQAPALEEGTAEASLKTPLVDNLTVESGRFGTAARYIRLPTLVADVSSVVGRPRLQYRVTVPALDIERHRSRLLEAPEQVRIHVSDVALPPPGREPSPGIYEGRIVVALQSFSTDRVILNRTVSIQVEPP